MIWEVARLEKSGRQIPREETHVLPPRKFKLLTMHFAAKAHFSVHFFAFLLMLIVFHFALPPDSKIATIKKFTELSCFNGYYTTDITALHYYNE